MSAGSLIPWVVLLAAVVAAVCRHRPGAALSYLITTTGFAAMILELALMLLFQLVHGAMIQTIGLLIALFMAGLWCGSMLTSARRPAQHDFRWLAGGEAGFILLCGALLLLFSVSGFTMSLSAIAAYSLILPLLLLCGFLTGLQFPPAVRLCCGESASGEEWINISGVNSRGAARIYAFDLLGGCLGGISGGLLLLPVFGFRATLLLLLLLKIGSFIALHISAIGGKIKK